LQLRGVREIPSLLILTLAELSGVDEGVFHSAPDMGGNFDTVSARPGHERNLLARQISRRMAATASLKVRTVFGIPGSGSGLELSCFREVMGPESDDREQAEEDGGGTQDRLVGPLRWVSTPR
jgi:hypothetical protein